MKAAIASSIERARQKAPNAIHVSVDNFMNSPKYDEVVSASYNGEYDKVKSIRNGVNA